MSEIRQISRQLVYENNWIRFYEDAIRFLDGSESVYGVVQKNDAALIIPIHADRRFQLVQQFRYPVGNRYWEFPKGSWQTTSAEDMAVVACGELEEETGYRANSLKKLGTLFQAASFATHSCHVFLASGLVLGRTAREREEQGMITAAFSRDVVDEMIKSGQIRDASTIAALGLLSLLETE